MGRRVDFLDFAHAAADIIEHVTLLGMNTLTLGNQPAVGRQSMMMMFSMVSAWHTASRTHWIIGLPQISSKAWAYPVCTGRALVRLGDPPAVTIASIQASPSLVQFLQLGLEAQLIQQLVELRVSQLSLLARNGDQSGFHHIVRGAPL